MTAAPPPAKSDTTTLIEDVLGGLYLAEQLDHLHLSIINLLDMVRDEEIALVLDQEEKTLKEKRAFIGKVVQSVRSPELRGVLEDALKRNDLSFFQEKELGSILTSLQSEASKIAVVRVTVAVSFEADDVREMAELLSHKVGKQAVVSLKVDYSLIGGAIIQQGNYLSDYSVKSQLDLFRSRWHRAVTDLN